MPTSLSAFTTFYSHRIEWNIRKRTKEKAFSKNKNASCWFKPEGKFWSHIFPDTHHRRWLCWLNAHMFVHKLGPTFQRLGKSVSSTHIPGSLPAPPVFRIRKLKTCTRSGLCIITGIVVSPSFINLMNLYFLCPRTKSSRLAAGGPTSISSMGAPKTNGWSPTALFLDNHELEYFPWLVLE